MIADRAQLHRLVDELPEASLEAAGRYLERAVDPMIAVLDAAPFDDEPLSPQDEAAIRDSERARAAGERFLTMAEIEAEIGSAHA